MANKSGSFIEFANLALLPFFRLIFMHLLRNKRTTGIDLAEAYVLIVSVGTVARWKTNNNDICLKYLHGAKIYKVTLFMNV